jgi:hypothetical protein
MDMSILLNLIPYAPMSVRCIYLCITFFYKDICWYYCAWFLSESQYMQCNSRRVVSKSACAWKQSANNHTEWIRNITSRCTSSSKNCLESSYRHLHHQQL